MCFLREGLRPATGPPALTRFRPQTERIRRPGTNDRLGRQSKQAEAYVCDKGYRFGRGIGHGMIQVLLRHDRSPNERGSALIADPVQ